MRQQIYPIKNNWFCVRWIDGKLTPHEEFIGLRPLVKTIADHIVLVTTNEIEN